MERIVLVHRREPHSEEGLTIEVLAVSRIILKINGEQVDCPRGKGMWNNHQVTAVLQGASVSVTIAPANQERVLPVVRPKIGSTQEEVAKKFGTLLVY